MKYLVFFSILLSGWPGYAQKAPYRLQLDAGFLFSEANVPAFSIQLFNGVKIPDWNAEAGVTAGYDNYETLDLFPLTLSVKWLPEIDQKWTPYLGLNAGFAIADKDDLGQFQSVEGGSTLSPSVGIRFNKASWIKWNVNIAYKVQKAKITSYDGFNDIPIFVERKKYTYRRLFLGLGFSF